MDKTGHHRDVIHAAESIDRIGIVGRSPASACPMPQVFNVKGDATAFVCGAVLLESPNVSSEVSISTSSFGRGVLSSHLINKSIMSCVQRSKSKTWL